MTLSFSFTVDNTDDLQKFLMLIKEQGFDKFINKPVTKKTTAVSKRVWRHNGIGELGSALDTINIRDYAYED
jgi:hypothetical protein